MFAILSSSAPRSIRRAVARAKVAPTTITAPVLASTPVEGSPVGFSAISYSYGTEPIYTGAPEWLINDVVVSGESGSTYTCLTADVGKTLKVRQTLTGQGGTATSTSTGAVVQAVGGGGTGTADLSWGAPSDTAGITGYKIYYGQAYDSEANNSNVSGVGTLTKQIVGLGSGRWYFKIRSVADAVEGGDMQLGYKDIA